VGADAITSLLLDDSARDVQEQVAERGFVHDRHAAPVRIANLGGGQVRIVGHQ
jgi:hypothetical protein